MWPVYLIITVAWYVSINNKTVSHCDNLSYQSDSEFKQSHLQYVFKIFSISLDSSYVLILYNEHISYKLTSWAVFKIRSEICWTEGQFCQNLYMTKEESLPDRDKFCRPGSAVRHLFWKLRLHGTWQVVRLRCDSSAAKYKHWNTTGAFTQRHAACSRHATAASPGGNLSLNFKLPRGTGCREHFSWRTLTSETAETWFICKSRARQLPTM